MNLEEAGTCTFDGNHISLRAGRSGFPETTRGFVHVVLCRVYASGKVFEDTAQRSMTTTRRQMDAGKRF